MPNVFVKTRLQFTLIFMTIMMVVIVFFSIVLFNLISRDVRIKTPFQPKPKYITVDQYQPTSFKKSMRRDDELLIRNEIIQNIQTNLIILDSFLFIFVSLIGYILSGFVLRPIKKSVEQQKLFLQNVSHDLKTPLAIMRTELEVELLDTSKKDNIVYKSLLEEVTSLSYLVNEVTLLSALDTPVSYPKEYIALRPIIEKQIGLFKNLIIAKGLTLTASIIDEGMIYGNTILFERALSNLLSNAIKYTSLGQITISAKKELSTYVIEITDTGEGIDEKEQQYVFNRFYKGDASRTYTDSSGLGLAIVKEIVTAHKGTITLSSRLNQGTRVLISFPLVDKKSVFS